MKWILVQSKYDYNVAFPLSLSSTATFLTKHMKEEVKCFDLNLQSIDSIIEFCKEWKPDVVGFNITSITKENVLESCEVIKKAFPEVKVMLGGAGAKVEYEELLKEKNVDVCFIADIEQLGVREKELGVDEINSLPGMCCKQEEEIVKNPVEPLKDIDFFSHPDRELDFIDHKKYLGSDVLDHPATILTSRGCPYRCTYCASSTERRVYMRSVENVKKELTYLRSLGYNNFVFEDYEMLVDQERTKEICKDLKEHESTWVLKTRVEKVTDEISKVMKESGCRMVYLGVETITQEAIHGANKHNISRESVEGAITNLKKNGIDICCSIQYGLPGDTEESFSENTVEFLAKILDPKTDMVQIHFTTLFPGTKLHEQYKDKGNYVNIHDDMNDVVAHGFEGFVMPHLSEDVIKRVYKKTSETLGELLTHKAIWSQNKEVESEMSKPKMPLR